MKYKVSAMTNWDSRNIVSVFVRANSEYDARRIGVKKSKRWKVFLMSARLLQK